MRLFNEDLERELILVETQKDDICYARKILEKAITKQIQALTLALYSSELLNGRKMEIKDLKLLRTICCSLFPNSSITTDEALSSFIADGVYHKRWAIVTPNDLYDVEIRIIGKTVKLWNVIEINEQLAILGSNYRLFFAGAMQLAGLYVKKLIGSNDNTKKMDCRYIWGIIGPRSISVGGPLFDFVIEEIISPFFDNNAPGFAIEDTAVLRRPIINEINNSSSDEVLHVYLHEVLHTISYSFKDGSPFTMANWALFHKRDICRFLKTPHTKEEVEITFKDAFLEDSSIHELATGKGTSHLSQLAKPIDIFIALLTDNIIQKDPNGLFFSNVYTEGQSWNIF